MSRMSHPPDNAHARRLRRTRQKQERRIAAAVAVAIVLIVGAFLIAGRSGGSSTWASSPTLAPLGQPSELLLFAVGTDQPYAAVLGTGGGRVATVAALPANLLTAIPGVGTGTVSSALRESPEFGRTAVSNVLGVWIPHYVYIQPEALAAAVDGRGGLTVNLPRAVSIDGSTVGPGPTILTGDQVMAYLQEGNGAERNGRWELVLAALFRGTMKMPHGATTDDANAASSRLAEARGAVVSEFPTQAAEGGYRNASAVLTKTALERAFGIQQTEPTPIVLLFGVRRPSAAEDATADLVPAGFQVVAYADARGLERHQRPYTTIDASQDALGQADDVAKALGVGKVFLSKEQSGLADITVILGKDYLAALG